MLKPAKNFRYIEPRCCMTCAYKIEDNGTIMCRRENGIVNDCNEGWTFVCDRYKSEWATTRADDDGGQEGEE